MRHISAIEKCFPLKESPSVTWIDVNGIHDTALVKRIGECFRLHPLFLEDIVTTGQYPKFEDFGDYVFVVLKMLEYEQGGQIAAEQVSIVLGPNFVISFQEKVADLFKPIRDMIQNNHLFRNRGSDYLAYSLIDLIIDRYFPILEKLGDDIEDKENQLIANPVSGTLGSIQQLKKELLFLRKSVWPLREVISSLSRGMTPLIKDETRIYLRDVQRPHCSGHRYHGDPAGNHLWYV